MRALIRLIVGNTIKKEGIIMQTQRSPQRMLRRTGLLVAGLLIVFLQGVAQEKSGTTEKSLYDRLGGVYALASVVDDFIERVLVNDVLNANPAINEARQRVPKAGLKYRVTEMVCQATGGPCTYTGRSMKESHAHLNISEKEWDALVVDFKASLAKFNVPQKEQQELLAIVGSTKVDIVMRHR
jgi:hemoglobin